MFERLLVVDCIPVERYTVKEPHCMSSCGTDMSYSLITFFLVEAIVFVELTVVAYFVFYGNVYYTLKLSQLSVLLNSVSRIDM